MPSSYITQPNIILQSYIYPYPQSLKSILSPIQYPNFYIPQFVSLFHCPPSIFHHFSPLLSIHLFHCGKCGKTCGKLISLVYKYPINQPKTSVNTPKSYLGYLLYFFLRLVFEYVVPLIYWEPMVPNLLCPKRLRLFSSSPHFVRVAVKPFFIYRTWGSQMKKPTSSCGHFGKRVLEWEKKDWIIVIVNILLII